MFPSSKSPIAALAAVFFLLAATAAQAQPSFDCSKASTRVENMICDHARIAELDSELADAYRIALRDSPWASANKRIRREQKEWIARRNQCRNKRCLRRAYIQRIAALHAEVPDGDAGDAPAQATPETMMARCRERAANVFHTRAPNIETKYEGQRTDGTHAVNGTAWLRSAEETFQCSFNANGRQIVRFIVN